MKLQLLILLSIISLQAQNFQDGIPFYKFYNSKTYKGGPQIFSIEQDKRGIIYAGNSYGILEFDGTNWRRIKTKENTNVWYLTHDENNRVYAATSLNFGVISANSNGTPYFKSLSDSLTGFKGNIINIE
ncbi:MAG: hypothetical protein D6677_01470, partial [Calditrichaeota bacterium]